MIYQCEMGRLQCIKSSYEGQVPAAAIADDPSSQKQEVFEMRCARRPNASDRLEDGRLD